MKRTMIVMVDRPIATWYAQHGAPMTEKGLDEGGCTCETVYVDVKPRGGDSIAVVCFVGHADECPMENADDEVAVVHAVGEKN